jgi:hypothetical protein
MALRRIVAGLSEADNEKLVLLGARERPFWEVTL